MIVVLSRLIFIYLVFVGAVMCIACDYGLYKKLYAIKCNKHWFLFIVTAVLYTVITPLLFMYLFVKGFIDEIKNKT